MPQIRHANQGHAGSVCLKPKVFRKDFRDGSGLEKAAFFFFKPRIMTIIIINNCIDVCLLSVSSKGLVLISNRRAQSVVAD